jgi:membrane-associated HD superfamily phosphohydrolase
MITISITATKEYLEKTERTLAPDGQAVSAVPMEKIVDNVFQMRLSKGSLDESGLTLRQFNDLKEFFLHM